MGLRRASATHVTADTNISRVFVTRIKQDSTNVGIRDDTAAAHRVQNGQGRRPGCGKEKATDL